MNHTDYLFNEFDTFRRIETQKAAMLKEIQEYNDNKLLNTSTDDLCRYFEQKYQLVAPSLREKDAIVEQREMQIDVSQDPLRFINDRSKPFYIPGTAIVLTIPFNGDPDGFQIRPSTFTYNPPIGKVNGKLLVLRIQGTNLSQEQVKASLEKSIREINEWLTNLKRDLDDFNRTILTVARQAIETRKARLLSDKKLVASLGFRIRERTDSPKTFIAPEVRRKIDIKAPPASIAPYTPEPAMSDGDYDHILNTIQSMALVMERSPSAFSSIDEEALRSHFLVQLNGHYQGQATGETFNYEGKTDILVRSNDKNIFVAECKYWDGPKKLCEAIDQILGYSCWRDTKVAIIIFNRRKSFTRVLEEIKDTVSKHSNYKRLLRTESDTVFRYLFAHKDDPNREMYLTVLAFDVPIKG